MSNARDGQEYCTTLIVASRDLIAQWCDEIAKHTEPGKLFPIVLYNEAAKVSGIDLSGIWMGNISAVFNSTSR